MRSFPLAGIALAIAVGPSCALAQSGMAVVVSNYAGAPRGLLEAASGSARLVFLGAGVETRWSIAEDRSVPVESDGALRVFVMPKLRRSAESDPGAVIAGSALLNPVYPRAYAFLDVVAAVSQRTTRSESAILACIFVHEIGHLLGLPHDKHGIMRADLAPAEIDNALRGRAFDERQGRALRAALLLRRPAALASPLLAPSPTPDAPTPRSIASRR